MKKIDKIKDNIINKINENNAFKRIDDLLDRIAKKFMEFNPHTSSMIVILYWITIYFFFFLFGFASYFILPCSVVIYCIYLDIMDRFLCRAKKFRYMSAYIDLGNNLIESVELIFTNEIEYYDFREKMNKSFYTTERANNTLYFKRKNLNNT